jgi:hypothetical protein
LSSRVQDESNIHGQTYRNSIHKKLYEFKPLEAWFPCDGPWRLKKMLKVSTVRLHADTAADRLVGFYVLPLCLIGAVCRDFLRNVLPQPLQDVDRRTGTYLCFMLGGAPPHFLLFSAILEQRVCGRMDRKRQTSSTARLFPWFKFVSPLSPGASTVYCLCYRIQWLPGLESTDAEWIWDDLYDTWNFPASQIITVQRCKVLRWSSRWTIWECSFIFKRP